MLLAVGSVLLAGGARGESLHLFAEADARILTISDSPAYENANYRDDILSVYTVADNIQRTLIRFNLEAATPGPGMRLESARLHLTASTGFGGNPDGSRMEVWRVSQPWVESEVTWIRASASAAWSMPGGDTAGGPHGAFAMSTADPVNGSAVFWDVTELVDLWLEGILPNHGLLLLSEAGNRLTFQQSETSQVGNLVSRPRLVLEQTPGVPRLRADLEAATGDAVLSWRDAGTAVLQEKPDTAAAGSWTDSPATVEVAEGRSVVHIAAASAPRYFRLRPAAGFP